MISYMKTSKLVMAFTNITNSLSISKKQFVIVFSAISFLTAPVSADSHTDTENIAIVDSYFTAIQTGDLETLGALVAEDVIWYQPGNNKFSGTHQGAPAVFGMIGGMMETSVGTFKINNVQSIMANGSKVAAVLQFSGQRDGAEMSMLGVDILTVENGKITEVWLYSSDQQAEDIFWGE